MNFRKYIHLEWKKNWTFNFFSGILFLVIFCSVLGLLLCKINVFDIFKVAVFSIHGRFWIEIFFTFWKFFQFLSKFLKIFSVSIFFKSKKKSWKQFIWILKINKFIWNKQKDWIFNYLLDNIFFTLVDF